MGGEMGLLVVVGWASRAPVTLGALCLVPGEEAWVWTD